MHPIPIFYSSLLKTSTLPTFCFLCCQYLSTTPGSDDDSENGDNDESGYGCDTNLECHLEGNREWAKDHIGNIDEMSEEDQESAISDVLNDVDEEYLDAQQEKENQNYATGEEEDSEDGK